MAPLVGGVVLVGVYALRILLVVSVVMTAVVVNIKFGAFAFTLVIQISAEILG